jgi:hypothetical protein
MRTVKVHQHQRGFNHEPTSRETYLLPEAYSGPGVEGEEYKRIRQDILPQPVIEEPIRVKYEGYGVACKKGTDEGPNTN